VNARRPRDIGTAAETAVTRVAQHHGFPYADRRAGRGVLDVGDITLCPGVIVEVKGGDAARTASDGDIERWLTETARERRNAGAAVAFLVVQRPRVGTLNAGRWWAWWRLGWVAELGGTGLPNTTIYATPVRCTLADALGFLRAAGWGDPLDPV
jgi:hypothetical protein